MKLNGYNKLRHLIKTGDAIVFSGEGRESSLIKRFTKSYWSHIGQALWFTPVPELEPRLFIFESTSLNTIPDIGGSYRVGVQVIPMSQRLEGYIGESAWAPLKIPVTEEEKLKLMSWIWSRHASSADYDKTQAIMAGLDPEKWDNWFLKIVSWPFRWFFDTKENQKKVFCSELVTKSLQLIGRVDLSINPSEQVPQDILDMGCFHFPISLSEDPGNVKIIEST